MFLRFRNKTISSSRVRQVAGAKRTGLRSKVFEGSGRDGAGARSPFETYSLAVSSNPLRLSGGVGKAGLPKSETCNDDAVGDSHVGEEKRKCFETGHDGEEPLTGLFVPAMVAAGAGIVNGRANTDIVCKVGQRFRLIADCLNCVLRASTAVQCLWRYH